MCASNTERSKKYSETRTSFEDLGVDEKAAFLVESTIQMVVKGVKEAGDAASEALKNMSVDFGNEAGDDSDGSTEEEAGKQADSDGKSAKKGKAGASTAKKKKKTTDTKNKSGSEDGDSA